MTLKIAILAAGLLLTASAVHAATPEESFRQSFPQVPLNAIRPGPVNGLYEIVSGTRIFYYIPGPEYVIAGAIYTRDGKNLTAERANELLAETLKGLPLAEALKIGQGPHQVIEVTDPDCSYCRQASRYLSQRKDLTRYIFFFPLPIHQDAEAKVRYIFCDPEPAAAYEEVMTGELDAMTFKTCNDPAVESRLKTHQELIDRAGINSTPMFLINGQFVEGADIPRMEKILGGKK